MNKTIKQLMLTGLLGLSSMSLSGLVQAVEKYALDIEGMHASIEFRVQHLGFSWNVGRFNKFDGHFSYDEKNPENSTVEINIDIASLDSNHAERDKHLRDPRFFNVEKYPTAKFVSTSYKALSEGKAEVIGNLTLMGVTKQVTLDVTQVGAGKDPWGGYRRGFAGTAQLNLSDYNMAKAAILGPSAENVELSFSVEGIRQ